MKKIALLSTMLSLVLLAQAQYESIKNKLLIVTPKNLQEAKEDVDKKMSNAKFASKPEAYMLKATIYAYLAADSTNKATGKSDAFEQEAEASLKKYQEMDASAELIKDPIYRNAAIGLYEKLFNEGYDYYQSKKYAESYSKFKKVSEYSDLLIKNQLLNSPVDTNVLILAAFTADNSDQKAEAVKYYKRLADANVTGDSYENVYRFLVTYYFTNKDMDSFEKYKALGLKYYPKSEFFTYDKVDFAVGLETDFDKKLAAIDELLVSDPNNYKANMNLVELAFEALHSEKDDVKKPANPAKLEEKMLKALTSLQQTRPEDPLPFVVMGDHYINMSILADKKREEHVADMRKRNKPGTPASKEDIAKRDQLEKEYEAIYYKATEPYEKGAALYAKKGNDLNAQEKQQYKKIAGYLGDIYTFKAARSKNAKPAEIAKFEAEAKKWNDIYGSIGR